MSPRFKQGWLILSCTPSEFLALVFYLDKKGWRRNDVRSDLTR